MAMGNPHLYRIFPIQTPHFSVLFFPGSDSHGESHPSATWQERDGEIHQEKPGY